MGYSRRARMDRNFAGVTRHYLSALNGNHCALIATPFTPLSLLEEMLESWNASSETSIDRKGSLIPIAFRMYGFSFS